ncbi:unnamed protein product [Mytilus edulis]|uniref:Uncharacterized protein n=1 Tax=Mytilus edulis TaxID=6550 RepID=A0A8S3RFF6_MYTED|nr:unnamed protein product [Mytilus edulis]
MATESVLTPRRVYDGQNVCLLCAFSFVHTEISSTGEKHEVKLFKHKLRLTDVRVNNVKKIIPSFHVTDGDTNNGFCTKCYKIVEKIFRQEEEVEKLKSSLIRTHQTCPKRSKTVEKRLLRSPFSSVQKKQQKTFPSQFMVKHAVKIPSFSAMCTMPLMGAGLGVAQPHVQSNEPATIVKQFIAIAPRPTEYDTSLSSVIGEHTHVKIPTVSYGAEKTARRSLGFSGKENEQNLPYEGEVKVDSQTIDSALSEWNKKHLCVSGNAQRICKTILQGVNVEKGVLNIIAESSPLMVMNAAAK